MLQRIALIAFLFFHCSEKQGASLITPDDKSPHFQTKLYDGVPASIAMSVTGELERHYDRILADMKLDTLPVIGVEIWDDANNFLSAMEKNIGQRYPGATGYVKYETMYLLNRGHVPQAAVHEFAHIASLHVNPRIGNNPRWLWEAVALYEAGDFVDPKSLSYMVNGNYPTLAQLNASYNNDQRIYAVGYTLTEFILHDWGRDAFIQLIKTNGSIESVLGLSVPEFEQNWYTFVKEKYLSVH